MRIHKPKYWVSLVTGERFLFSLYCNHGKGGKYIGFEDLPLDKYPYTLTYYQNGLQIIK